MNALTLTPGNDGPSGHAHPPTPDDRVHNRGRRGRRIFYFGTWIASPALGLAIALLLCLAVTGNWAFGWLVGILGAGAAWYERLRLDPLFHINNTTTGMFITIDTLRSWFYGRDIFVYYGPGDHLSYPWERRYGENNILLDEGTNTFEFEVVCTDGVVRATGSYRLRPEQRSPRDFLAGAGAVANDLRDLIITNAVEKLSNRTVKGALRSLEELNRELAQKFVGTGVTPFEARFGIHVGDATVSQLLPTKEVQRTISSLTEAAAIRKGIALLLGFDNMKQVREAEIPQADIKDARDRFLSISGNLEGMDISRYEVVLSTHGVDPALADAIAGLARNVAPAVAAWREANRPRRGGRRRRQNRGDQDGQT